MFSYLHMLYFKVFYFCKYLSLEGHLMQDGGRAVACSKTGVLNYFECRANMTCVKKVAQNEVRILYLPGKF